VVKGSVAVTAGPLDHRRRLAGRRQRGGFAVEPAGNRARIIWESSFVALNPAAEAEVRPLWAGMMPVVLGNLKTLIEEP
jgi:hypothetical protein